MSGEVRRDRRGPDAVAAWATGTGIGFVVLMVTWLATNRLMSLVADPPVGPTVALVLAIAAGLISALVSGRRLVASVTTNRPGRPLEDREMR